MKAHVAPWKKKNVQELEDVLTSKPVVALVGIDDIPAKSIQKIRAGLRGKAIVRSGKNNLIKLALEGAKGKVAGLDKLEAGIEGQTAIVASDLNPFALYKEFEASRAMAPARPNQIAPNDIIVKKGDTAFKPGPVVGDLQQAGIPAAIEQGKVVIKKDSTVVKAGEAISPQLASALEKLEIYPIEIGLAVRGVFEDGVVYQSDVLAIDDAAFRNELATAIGNATALAVDRAWATPHTIRLLLGKAVRNALAVGIEAAFLEKDTIDPILSKAYLQMLALARLASDEALDEELKAALGAAAAATAAAPAAEAAEEKVEEAEEEEETVSEEEAAGGLGALFD